MPASILTTGWSDSALHDARTFMSGRSRLQPSTERTRHLELQIAALDRALADAADERDRLRDQLRAREEEHRRRAADAAEEFVVLWYVAERASRYASARTPIAFRRLLRALHESGRCLDVQLPPAPARENAPANPIPSARPLGRAKASTENA
jgi:hypothetical protein